MLFMVNVYVVHVSHSVVCLTKVYVLFHSEVSSVCSFSFHLLVSLRSSNSYLRPLLYLPSSLSILPSLLQ
jgi:hypothetical protein